MAIRSTSPGEYACNFRGWDFVIASFIELDSFTGSMSSHELRNIEPAAFSNIIGDASIPEAVISDFCFNACLDRPSSNWSGKGAIVTPPPYPTT